MLDFRLSLPPTGTTGLTAGIVLMKQNRLPVFGMPLVSQSASSTASG
jgi:hypothetical protein